ncbi:MAG: hypothetical protein IKJ80_06340 [Clostridia bacterium]|nr:hypothetical protein [Clostridia bacterium]
MLTKKFFRAACFCIALALLLTALCIFSVPAAATEDRIAAAADYIAEAVDAYSEDINVSAYNLTREELESAVQMVIYEHHELFFLAQTWSFYKNASTGYVTRMLPEYRYDIDDIPEMREEYVNLFNAFVSSCNVTPDDSEYERALAVHDKMCSSFAYDDTYVIDCTYELLLYGEGVCEALSILYEAVLTHLGVECDTVIDEPEHHCWNVVKLDGEWYHVDVTWADPLTYGGGINEHDYFLLSDERLAALNSADGGGHSSWAPAISATGTKYYNATLAESEMSMLQYGNEWFSIDKTNKTIGVYDISDFSYTPFYKINESWKNLSKPGYSWLGALSGFALYNSRLYFNTPTAIMSIGIENGDVRTELTPALNGGNIYGFDMILDNIIYYYGTTPNAKQTAVSVPIPTHAIAALPTHFDGAALDAKSDILTLDTFSTVAAIKALFPNETITVTTASGAALTSGTVTTGCTVTSTIGESTASVTVAVIGDVNGDGAIDSADALAISEGLVDGFEAAAASAADLNRDGEATSSDLLYAVGILKF